MRLIDAHEYYKELKKEMAWPDRSQEFIDAIEVAIEDLGDMPTLSLDDLRPKGRWVVKPLDGTEALLLPHCSECGKPHAREWNFCNECGADMKGDVQDV